MFRNLANLQAELINRLKANNSSLSSTRTAGWLNEGQDDVANEFDFEHLRMTDSFTTVANQRKYFRPFAYLRVSQVMDTTNNNPIYPETEDWILARDPDLSETGSPMVYSIWGYEFLRGQLPSAQTVKVRSTDATDTTQKVCIRGDVLQGSDVIEGYEILTLNGTTFQTTSTTFQSLHSIAKDSATTGVVTAVDGATGLVTLAVIPGHLEMDARQPLYLWPTPTDALGIYVRGWRAPRRMVAPSHFPDMPETYHELVLLAGLIRGHRDLLRFKLASEVEKNEFAPRLAQLKKEQGHPRANRSPVLAGGFVGRPEIGRYPSNFPIK